MAQPDWKPLQAFRVPPRGGGKPYFVHFLFCFVWTIFLSRDVLGCELATLGEGVQLPHASLCSTWGPLCCRGKWLAAAVPQFVSNWREHLLNSLAWCNLLQWAIVWCNCPAMSVAWQGGWAHV